MTFRLWLCSNVSVQPPSRAAPGQLLPSLWEAARHSATCLPSALPAGSSGLVVNGALRSMPPPGAPHPRGAGTGRGVKAGEALTTPAPRALGPLGTCRLAVETAIVGHRAGAFHRTGWSLCDSPVGLALWSLPLPPRREETEEPWAAGLGLGLHTWRAGLGARTQESEGRAPGAGAQVVHRCGPSGRCGVPSACSGEAPQA